MTSPRASRLRLVGAALAVVAAASDVSVLSVDRVGLEPDLPPAADLLAGRRVRVVSMPCVERFAAQDAAYRDAVLPPDVRARVVVEAGVTVACQ